MLKEWKYEKEERKNYKNKKIALWHTNKEKVAKEGKSRVIETNSMMPKR
jgi:hypothetical protein